MATCSVGVARGETPKARGGIGALGVWAVLGVIVLLVALAVASSFDGCDPFGTPPPPPPPPPAVVTAQGSFGELHDRDGAHAPSLAELGPQLRARGYEPLASLPARDLPFEVETSALDGMCGVAVFVPEPTTSLDAVHRGPDSLRPAPPGRTLSVGVCGAASLRATGTGQAGVELFAMPGLTPDDVAASELPDEVALLLAEAEHILGRRGFRAHSQVVRAELTPPRDRWEPPAPDAGCVSWVVVVLRFWRAYSSQASHPVDDDDREWRLMLGAISCHGESAAVTLESRSNQEGVLYALPFLHDGGPRMPGADATRVVTVGEARVVPTDRLALP